MPTTRPATVLWQGMPSHIDLCSRLQYTDIFLSSTDLYFLGADEPDINLPLQSAPPTQTNPQTVNPCNAEAGNKLYNRFYHSESRHPLCKEAVTAGLIWSLHQCSALPGLPLSWGKKKKKEKKSRFSPGICMLLRSTLDFYHLEIKERLKSTHKCRAWLKEDERRTERILYCRRVTSIPGWGILQFW